MYIYIYIYYYTPLPLNLADKQLASNKKQALLLSVLAIAPPHRSGLYSYLSPSLSLSLSIYIYISYIYIYDIYIYIYISSNLHPSPILYVAPL